MINRPPSRGAPCQATEKHPELFVVWPGQVGASRRHHSEIGRLRAPNDARAVLILQDHHHAMVRSRHHFALPCGRPEAPPLPGCGRRWRPGWPRSTAAGHRWPSRGHAWGVPPAPQLMRGGGDAGRKPDQQHRGDGLTDPSRGPPLLLFCRIRSLDAHHSTRVYSSAATSRRRPDDFHAIPTRPAQPPRTFDSHRFWPRSRIDLSQPVLETVGREMSRPDVGG